MEDKDIIALYWARSEEAIRQTAEKYGAYCGQIIRRPGWCFCGGTGTATA